MSRVSLAVENLCLPWASHHVWCWGYGAGNEQHTCYCWLHARQCSKHFKILPRSVFTMTFREGYYYSTSFLGEETAEPWTTCSRLQDREVPEQRLQPGSLAALEGSTGLSHPMIIKHKQKYWQLNDHHGHSTLMIKSRRQPIYFWVPDHLWSGLWNTAKWAEKCLSALPQPKLCWTKSSPWNVAFFFLG